MKPLLSILLLSFSPALTPALIAQANTTRDSVATVTVSVTTAKTPVEAAVVRAGRVGAQTDARGTAILRLPVGRHTIVASKVGLRSDSTIIAVARDTAITIALETSVAEIEAVLVSATRSERRVEDVPLRVEVIDEEEIAEKVAMTPGDIAMMLNETSGLRVQTTSPSLGGANVRIQGLLGRYSLLLADGLPLYGGQAGGLGLLQIPPVDLGRVEIIKGTASALYGSSALGGVVNLLSRRPATSAEHTALLNQTSRGGTDAVVFLSAPLSGQWGYTLLTGAHRQTQQDLDGDRWTDLPGYERVVVRPRFYFDDGQGRSAFVTAGFTGEDRNGGTLDGGLAPDGLPFAEGLGTRRLDVGALARWVLPNEADDGWRQLLRGSMLTVRGSAVTQRHNHTFGAVKERDRHQTSFAEASLAVPRGRMTYVGGVAFQQDRYTADDVAGFDYTFNVPAAFAQLDLDPAYWVSLSGSARVDAHNYGTTVNPRVSMLLRRPTDGALSGWTSRLSVGTGTFAPTPFTERTEATGLTPLLPLRNLAAERATSGSVDVGGPLETPMGHLQINATVFGSLVRHPLQLLKAEGTVRGAHRIALSNAPEPVRTGGGELLARFEHELGEGGAEGDEPPLLRVNATYTYLRSTECNLRVSGGILNGCERREVPLNPRHAAGIVAAVEQEGKSRVGVEVYYTGRQTLEDNPYRSNSRPYVVVGLLAERAVQMATGTARFFVNFENITNVRQTRFDRLVLPARGEGGRWTTDAWTELTGFTMNGGVRFAF